MFDSFIGRHENKIDGKFRMSIPSDFRRTLDAGDPDRDLGTPPRILLVIGNGDRGYVEGCTMDWLAKLKEKIRKFRPKDPRRLALESLIFENSVLLTLDPQGRIVVPTAMRTALGLTDAAVFAGRNETFHIWEPSAYEADRRPAEPDPEIDYHPDKDPMDYLDGDEFEV